MTHVSVQNLSKGPVTLSLCQTCCHKYHCPFCHPSVFQPCESYNRVWDHIESHRVKAVRHKEFTIFICHLECRKQRHFHCPYCPKTLLNRKEFLQHIIKCEESVTTTPVTPGTPAVTPGTPAVTPDTPAAVTPATSGAPAVTPDTAAADTPGQPSATLFTSTTMSPGTTAATPGTHVFLAKVPQPPLSQSIYKEHIKCPNCGLWLYKKNLRRHILKKHTSTINDITAAGHLRSQCIDKENGVFAVAKSFRGTCFPIHAIKKTWGNTHRTHGTFSTIIIHLSTKDLRRCTGLSLWTSHLI
ncbi:uncharacterized protein LOC143317609 [Chaetodon auriga]|uniref:uncharacterized protein LOC143317609 n=1 Tax=Chaetodon auriga TaxID=39042 RepID=UPI004032E439